jgi:hypothetical protein
MRKHLDEILDAVRTLEREQLPRFLGDLREIEAVALGRLSAPITPAPPDESLNVKQAAKRLGISPSYLYKNHGHYKFARHEGGRLIFSASGLEKYLQSKSR